LAEFHVFEKDCSSLLLLANITNSSFPMEYMLQCIPHVTFTVVDVLEV
jgi:hypothetical protein